MEDVTSHEGGPSADQGWGTVDLATIWKRSEHILLDQVHIIERAVVAGIERRLDAVTQGDAAREAHKLAGSLGTFGFHEGSRLARALELALAPGGVVDPNQALGLSRLVMELQAEMARPLSAPPAAPQAGSGPAPLLVVDADVDRARRVVEAAAAQGLRTLVAPTLDAARRLVETATPQAVVVDAAAGAFGGKGDELSRFVSDLAGRRPAVAVVVLVEQADAGERVQAARTGARVILQKPVPPDAVVQAVSRILAGSQSAGKVLALDDDATFLVLVQEVLAAQGLAVESLGDAAGLWPALEAVEPDLLLLDNEMPGLDGVSLCRAIRADDRWARLPIVFLSGSGSPEVVRAMFAAGADDFVPKPLSIDDLVTRVVNRLRRSQVQSERPDMVLATGLPIERAFIEGAGRLLGLARQEGRPAVLAVAQLDPPTPPAVAAFGRRLRQAAAPEDAVGTWAGGRVAALLYGLTAAEAQDRLGRVLRGARAAGAGVAPAVAVGIAAAPDDGADLRSLGPAAEAALARARTGGAGTRSWFRSRPAGDRPRWSTCFWSTTTRRSAHWWCTP
jgi:DNA-binding response OmpR family regulator